MVEELSPETVCKRIERGETFDLIDIRDDEDYAEGHLPSADHLTIEELENIVVDRDWADEVVIYCYIGQTSVQAARLVEKYGDSESVASMAGGYNAWKSVDTVTSN
ncbi:rhodanese-like domain-containing protein [Halegenticoccus tardaugens]|uniref:rhodanese-like domain-containing protein n=1 Tax=Halegenticoccus tardaugens TaxID=2071624 RepID=UPI00100B30AC|nr:rhodanese-like domain-containing protein [Halegenticoccus tardaugens]